VHACKIGVIRSKHPYYNLFIHAAFLDYDGATVWGTPWEMAFEDSYLIHSKGGQITGYSGFMTFLPELQLSTYMVLIIYHMHLVYNLLIDSECILL